MKTASPALIALLQTNSFIMADLYTFTLRDGSVYRFTNYDIDLTWGGNTYSKSGVFLKRNGVKIVTGVKVDSLSVTAYAQSDYIIGGTSFFKLIANGGLDGANMELYRLFFTDPINPIEDMWVFSGRVSESTVTRFEATLQINSDVELLNIQMPRNVYQASCVHAVYDSGCQAVKTAVNKTVLSGSTKNVIIASLTQATGYFDEGIIEFTSGANNGIRRTIKTQIVGNITLALYLPNTPSVGDTFKLYAGCDRTIATCQSKFNNIANFRGYPYIPIPESIR